MRFVLGMAGLSAALLFGCSSEPEVEAPAPPTQPEQKPPDVGEAIQKRIEGKTEEALVLLRELNVSHPNSPVVLTLLGRTLLDAEDYPLAAFRLEQAANLGAAPELFSEAAEAHVLSGDDSAAKQAYLTYLKAKPDDAFAHLSLARALNRLGEKDEALNVFLKASEKAGPEDTLATARLFLEKAMYPQAEHWFRSAEQKAPGASPAPFHGLLEARFRLEDEDSVETIALAMEKTHPGTLDDNPRADEVAELLQRRRGIDFFQKGVSPAGKTASELAAILIGSTGNAAQEPVVGGTKLPPAIGGNQTTEPAEADAKLPLARVDANATQEANASAPPSPPSLADVFAKPPEPAVPVALGFLEEAELAMINRNYRGALLFTRRALRENQSDAEAWNLASQAHFLLGEMETAEMKALEAVRHAPGDLGIHMDYLRIARQTLPSHRYLEELERAHERFPASVEILWQLARRYHLTEKKPATAAVLFRKLLTLAPEDHPLRPEAERELRAMGGTP